MGSPTTYREYAYAFRFLLSSKSKLFGSQYVNYATKSIVTDTLFWL